MLTGLNHITLAVGEVDRSFRFYVDILGFSPRARWLQGAYLSLNGLWLCLSLDKAASTRASQAPDYTHIAFSVDQDVLAEYRAKLGDAKAPIWKSNTSEGDSVYFLDPDGHKLELHCGDLQSRLESLRLEPYDKLELFD